MADTASLGTPRAPWHLWLVGILALLWNAMGAFDYLMTQTENERYMASFTPEQLDYFYGFPAWLVAFWAIAVWGGLLGAVLLLARKRLAKPVFLASLVAMIITAIHNFLLTNGLEVMGATGAVFTVIIFLIAVGLVAYSSAMAKKGVLR